MQVGLLFARGTGKLIQVFRRCRRVPTASTSKYLKNRRAVFWAVAGSALVLVACSSTNSEGSSVSTTVPVLQGTLPGETRQDAIQRIFRSCLDTLGVPYDLLEKNRIGFRATPDLSLDEIQVRCEAEAQAAGLIEDRPRTAEEIIKDHQRLAKWAECLRSAGYDPGPLISLEEFLAAGGVVDPLPGLVLMMNVMSMTELDQLEIDCPQW